MGKKTVNPDKRYPFTLKLTFEERTRLEWEANGIPLAEHIRMRLFGNSMPQKRHRQKQAPVKDHTLLAKLLAMMGQSNIANNLNQLAKAVNSGSLPVTPETENAIHTACKDVRTMRNILLSALGLRSGD